MTKQRLTSATAVSQSSISHRIKLKTLILAPIYEYRGDTSIASWEVHGGTHSNAWRGDLIWDGNLATGWHSNSNNYPEVGLEINFINGPVDLLDVALTVRKNCCESRYRDVCLYADNVQVACTPPSPWNAGRNSAIHFMRDHALVTGVWSGNSDEATWTETGGNKPASGDDRTVANIFDNDLNTYWHGVENQADQTLTITFKKPIKFRHLDWTTRPDNIHEQERYREACLLLDGVESTCVDKQRVVTTGEVIRLSANAVATEVKLTFPREAIVADLKIHYG